MNQLIESQLRSLLQQAEGEKNLPMRSKQALLAVRLILCGIIEIDEGKWIDATDGQKGVLCSGYFEKFCKEYGIHSSGGAR